MNVSTVDRREVVITGIDIPFLQMVRLLTRAGVACIPAAVLLTLSLSLVWLLFMGVMGVFLVDQIGVYFSELWTGFVGFWKGLVPLWPWD